MTARTKIKALIAQGEGLSLEFKRSTNKLPANFFETVCAFLNLNGGTIILGVEDNGVISGVAPDAVASIKHEIANLSNNPQKITPPHLLFPHEEKIGDKWIISVLVPASSQVHQVGGKVYLRSEDGDYQLKGTNQLAGLMNRKLSFFTEQRVYPFLGLSDLDPALFEKARLLMKGRITQHPWATLSNEELLKVAGFIRQDYTTGKMGYTLAAALMFGYDTTIQSIVPGYKFDALLRRNDTERYDDRLIIRGNLIDAFDQLMGFVDKHLNDPFYMEGVASISLRSVIFRELVANIIAHREYTSAAPATMIIYTDRVEFKNPNVPHYHGYIDPTNFTPFPKNPTICKFMIQIGRYEELGSGVRKVNHYLPHYAPGAGKPLFIDGNMFEVIIPLGRVTPQDTPQDTLQVVDQVTDQVADQVTDQVTGEVLRLLHVIKDEMTRAEIQAQLELKHLPHLRTAYLNPALKQGLIEYTIPDKPTSRLQKYRLTTKGQALLSTVASQVTPQDTPQVAGEVTGEVTGEVAGEVLKLLSALTTPLTRAELQHKMDLEGQDHFRNHYLTPALQAGLIEMTIPDKPTSRLQKYRLTAKGRTLLTSFNQKAQP